MGKGRPVPAGPAAGGESLALGHAARDLDQELPDGARPRRFRERDGAAQRVAAGRHGLPRVAGPSRQDPRERERRRRGELGRPDTLPARCRARARNARRGRQPVRDRERRRHHGAVLAGVPRQVRAALGAAARRAGRKPRRRLPRGGLGRDPGPAARLDGAGHDRAGRALARRHARVVAGRELPGRGGTSLPGGLAAGGQERRGEAGRSVRSCAARYAPTIWSSDPASSWRRRSRSWSSGEARGSSRCRWRSRTSTTSSATARRTPRR